MSNTTINNELLTIKKMLTAIMKSQGNLHWIGGYVYGRTSNDDPFIILYPAGDYLEHKVCRVYEHDFRKLPDFIQTADVPADTDANPDKSKAVKRGIYHECPKFAVATYDGKDTQMGREKRFSDVLYVSKAPPAPAQAGPPPPSNHANRPDGEAEHWRNEALTAANPLMFDTAVARLWPFYGAAENVASTRQVLFGDGFEAGRTAAYLESLKVYREKRKELEEDGRATAVAHREAKTEALNVFNRVGAKV